nr:glutamate-1-semialdehyde 2,1-aminomutase, chloroplastic-like [Tanacetum cinerariifolium]
MTTSENLFARAQDLIPGGVNSPVRAFRAVGGAPIFMQSAEGAWLTDVDGNKYVDFINSWGPMILGHAPAVVLDAVREALPHSLSYGAPTRREVELAELLIEMVPSVEKFEGCYHGHGDSFLIAAGSGALTLGAPDSPGVTEGVARDTITVPYNDVPALKAAIAANPGQIATIIIEPVVGNMGLVEPAPGFLAELRALCTEHGIV